MNGRDAEKRISPQHNSPEKSKTKSIMSSENKKKKGVGSVFWQEEKEGKGKRETFCCPAQQRNSTPYIRYAYGPADPEFPGPGSDLRPHVRGHVELADHNFVQIKSHFITISHYRIMITSIYVSIYQVDTFGMHACMYVLCPIDAQASQQTEDRWYLNQNPSTCIHT